LVAGGKFFFDDRLLTGGFENRLLIGGRNKLECLLQKDEQKRFYYVDRFYYNEI